MPLELDRIAPDFESRFQTFLDLKRALAHDVRHVVTDILSAVADKGDEAVIAYTKRFDAIELTPRTMRVDQCEIEAAKAQCDPQTAEALRLAARRIAAFHETEKPQDNSYSDDAGVRLGHRWTAIDAVGLYVPGGLASYPSSVLMNAIPARIAGVQRIVMTVPAPDGVLNPLVLMAASLAGVDEIYRIGGAQAIGALAYGTASVPAVDKIVGPGNAYVAEAKRQVFGRVGIDTIAGPSEILVVADGANDPSWIAIDLLSQAEHGEDAQAILITDDRRFAGQVKDAIHTHLKTLDRADIAARSWDAYGAIIIVETLDEAIPLINRIAPEHLELAIDDPEGFAAHVRHAGALFLGRYTPEALGDYVAGPNHVLPTSKAARFSGGLYVADFMKRTTFVGCTKESLARIGPAAVQLAKAEGLDAHSRSVSIRLRHSDGSQD